MTREEITNENKELASIMASSIIESSILTRENVENKIFCMLNAFRLKEVVIHKDQWKKHSEGLQMEVRFYKNKLKEILPESMMEEMYHELDKMKTDVGRNN